MDLHEHDQRAMDALNAKVNHQQQQMETDLVVATLNFNIDEIPEELVQNVLFDSLCRRGQMTAVMGFTEKEVCSIYHLMCPYIIIVHQPGAQPCSSYLDMLVCFQSWAKLGLDYVNLAFLLGDISSSHVEDNIAQIRPKLRSTMTQKWFDQPPQHPCPLAKTPFPHIALFVDATTTPCFQPKAGFDKAKIF